MPNERGQTIDKTYLSINNAEKRLFLHRDYIAHCLRWSHIIKYLQEKQRYKNSRVLDIGCGKEAPLLKTLYTSRLLPYHYLGIDYGKITILETIPSLNTDKISGHFALYPETNILDFEPNECYTPEVIVMLEVLEHVEKDMGIEVLKHIKYFMDKDSVLFLSTPCYDGVNKAANHVYEWQYGELAATFTDLGYILVNVWGTFASLKDYIHCIPAEWLPVFNHLRTYYDVNVLSCIFAPIFPAQSRNCLWQLRKEEVSG